LRLDRLLFDRGLFPTRERARRAIMAGWVEVEGQRVDKPGHGVAEDARLEVRQSAEPYVSRGGRKLEAALDHFGVDPTGRVCLDVGASTGGFTDCLLQRGARRVYAIDVGYGQLDYRLREDPRVITMERLNARYLPPDALPEPVDLATVDVSFISITKVAPALLPLLRPGARLLPLIKPQFEAGRAAVGKGGVVRDPGVRSRAVAERVEELERLGLVTRGVFESPVHGPKGNVESFALFDWPGSGSGAESGEGAAP
jgi:23S rRNA (cytidine1920-2'-O)/16S rRNA (cytidine1409-2'-O)-methyltransferase